MVHTRIRRYQTDDAFPFYEAVMESKEELSQWFHWCHSDYSIKDASNWVTEMVPYIWQSKRGCEFVIEDALSKKIVGGVCLEQMDLEKQEAGVGYWIRTTEVGKGRATEAARQLIDFGFETLRLKRIHVIPSVDNMASQKVAQKLPFAMVKKVPGGFLVRDQISDALVFTITRASYLSSKIQKPEIDDV